MDNRTIIHSHLDKEYLSNIDALEIDYDPSKPTIVIADDYSSIISLFKKLMKRMKLDKKCNIIYAESSAAPVIILKTLIEYPDMKIDIVITDITFGLMAIDANRHKKYIDGVYLTTILKELNENLVYLFVTGHVLNVDSTNEYFIEYKKINDDDLLDHVVYKDTPISTNTEIIEKLFKGTEYENLVN